MLTSSRLSPSTKNLTFVKIIALRSLKFLFGRKAKLIPFSGRCLVCNYLSVTPTVLRNSNVDINPEEICLKQFL